MARGYSFLIFKMPKPEEVFIIIDEDGLPKKDTMVTEDTFLYHQMK